MSIVYCLISNVWRKKKENNWSDKVGIHWFSQGGSDHQVGIEDGNFVQSQCLSINVDVGVLDFNGGYEVDVHNHPVISDWGSFIWFERAGYCKSLLENVHIFLSWSLQPTKD